MAYTSFTCPECNSETILNDERDFGYCSKCGMRIPIDHESDESTVDPQIKTDDADLSTGELLIRTLKFWK